MRDKLPATAVLLLGLAARAMSQEGAVDAELEAIKEDEDQNMLAGTKAARERIATEQGLDAFTAGLEVEPEPEGE